MNKDISPDSFSAPPGMSEEASRRAMAAATDHEPRTVILLHSKHIVDPEWPKLTMCGKRLSTKPKPRCKTCEAAVRTRELAVQRMHCWENGPHAEDGCSTSCMEWEGHSSPHAWVRDDQIELRFK